MFLTPLVPRLRIGDVIIYDYQTLTFSVERIDGEKTEVIWQERRGFEGGARSTNAAFCIEMAIAFSGHESTPAESSSPDVLKVRVVRRRRGG